MNRRQLRGRHLDIDCDFARTVAEYNGDTVCGGLHKESKSFFLSEYDVVDKCRACKAWHVNWNESERSKNGND